MFVALQLRKDADIIAGAPQAIAIKKGAANVMKRIIENTIEEISAKMGVNPPSSFQNFGTIDTPINIKIAAGSSKIPKAAQAKAAGDSDARVGKAKENPHTIGLAIKKKMEHNIKQHIKSITACETCVNNNPSELVFPCVDNFDPVIGNSSIILA